MIFVPASSYLEDFSQTTSPSDDQCTDEGQELLGTQSLVQECAKNQVNKTNQEEFIADIIAVQKQRIEQAITEQFLERECALKEKHELEIKGLSIICNM